MNTALHEVCVLRNEQHFELDTHNQNRYRIVAKDSDFESAYYFSTPIYNKKSRKLVQRSFDPEGEIFIFEGSSSHVTVHGENLTLANSEGSVTFKLPSSPCTLRDGKLFGNNWYIIPTFNGVCVYVNQPVFSTRALINRKFDRVRHTQKHFAVMQDHFTPFFTLSPLMCLDSSNQIIPAEVYYNEINDYEYILNVTASHGETLVFEINLYEPKLFLDTTVESKHPTENNAFGSAAFLGKTLWMGEQWLYSRPDFSKMPELYSHEILHVLLHIPSWPAHKNNLSAYAPQARFCSFGSTWENKINHTEQITQSKQNGNYLTLDLTQMLVNPSSHKINLTHGLIVKNNQETNGYGWFSTGDCCAFPQVTEVKIAR